MHQSVSIALEDGVDPDGGFDGEWVVEKRLGGASFLSLDTLGDVQGSSNVSTVQTYTWCNAFVSLTVR